ncbi:MBL fold metallo-hydrolase [Anaerostipes sp.]|uniref:MBL fold metallo-hydrolase n=1 Tax=Anaerostipes sp. TaxID=1872530 RepID=UPI0025BD8DF8|nr:MBL fold metallo-hydrolase [Anaerostipes sp.]MBS7009737.1 MBL fold metallo-hydrolase [Anaerostipes sp.]
MKVTFIEHSGFCVELEHTVLLFDYYKGEIPDMPEDKELYVFASHSHHDHFNPKIFELEKTCKKIHYILSEDIPAKASEKITKIGEHENKTIGSIRVETLKSNDEGVAFLVTAEGKTIYHAGDLNWWYWNGEPEDDNEYMIRTYKEEVERLKGRDIDLAFLLLDPRQEDKYCKGINYFMEEIHPKAVFPMHAFGEYKISRHYLNCDDGRAYQGIVRQITRAGEEFTV